MAYEAQKFEHLLGCEGFSDNLLNNHFKLYNGYVNRTNKAIDTMKGMVESGDTGASFQEIKRRFGWEFNGMRLHEYYFGNMTKGGNPPKENCPVKVKLEAEYGSVEAWKKDFMSVASMPGIGWVILAYDPCGDRMFNVWINEHDLGHLAGCTPLLVLDVFEHAFMVDYGLAKADYLTAFFNNVDFTKLAERFSK